ncbi:hypothetical protein HZF02_15655 [Pseudomonas yamanorum]|nr:hypothetical protein HZF02_15655 [Pseudomonas yamanorum]
MTSQTIDGVRRELLKSIFDTCMFALRIKDYNELRDLLDAPMPLWNPHPDTANLAALLIALAQHGMKVSGGKGDEAWIIETAAVPQGQLVACSHEWTDDGEFLLVCTACGAQEDYTQALQRAFELGGTDDGSYLLEAAELCEVMRLYAEQPAPVAVGVHQRSHKDYAIEHAEYMATTADHVMEEFQAYGLALMAVDEGGDDGEDELFDAVDSARQDLQEALVTLRGRVYEFRKRRDRIDTPLTTR